MPTLGRPQKLAVINESGLYSLIFLSRKPEEKSFKKWITSEVLLSIRQAGSYGQKVDLNDQPKVQFHDQYINAGGLNNLQNAARALNQNPNLFISSLKNTYLFYQGSTLVAYQRYMTQGFFVVKSSIVNNVIHYQTYITPKGVEHFLKRNNLTTNLKRG